MIEEAEAMGTGHSFQERIAWAVAEFERVSPLVNPDGVWPCDVGAVVLAELCDRARVRREVKTGVYRHATPADCARAVGEDPERLTCESADEHHTWLEITDEAGGRLRLDPNGEVRGEPRVQRIGPGESPYRPFEAGSEWIELEADVTAAELVAEDWDSRLARAVGLLASYPG